MIYLILGIVLLGIIAFVAGYIREKKLKKQLAKGEITELPSIKQIEDMECCGQHETCEKDSLLAAVSREIEYYNDEELDRFRGVANDEYLPEEIEEFRDIMYTMREEEVAGWVRSLQLRAINVPDELKDEIFMIIGERRG